MRARPKLPAYGLLVAFLVATFLLGGGSRHDIASLALLRPLACLVAAAGLLTLKADALRGYRGLFILLGALALLMLVQLVPLPPSVWGALPDRSTIHQLDMALGMPDVWRPITLSPMKTANSLASLLVPFASLVLFIQLSARQREQILVVIVGVGVAGALLGIVQQLSGSGGAFFFYDITNRGSAVGLFANRNHHAVFLCCALLIALYLAHARRQAPRANRLVPLLAAVVLFVAILANPSRAGLICLGVALAIAAIALLSSLRASGHQQAPSLRLVPFAFLLVPAVAIVGLFAAAGRSPALSRLLGDGQLEEYRARILPDLLDMALAYQPWGSGFGAFEYAFRMRERAELLEPAYLNNAHNDWLQWIIEAGAPGLVLALGAAALMVSQLVFLVRLPRRGSTDCIRPAWLGVAILVVLAIASVVDYPLRVPSIISLATIALALFFGSGLDQRNACRTEQSR